MGRELGPPRARQPRPHAVARPADVRGAAAPRHPHPPRPVRRDVDRRPVARADAVGPRAGARRGETRPRVIESAGRRLPRRLLLAPRAREGDRGHRPQVSGRRRDPAARRPGPQRGRAVPRDPRRRPPRGGGLSRRRAHRSRVPPLLQARHPLGRDGRRRGRRVRNRGAAAGRVADGRVRRRRLSRERDPVLRSSSAPAAARGLVASLYHERFDHAHHDSPVGPRVAADARRHRPPDARADHLRKLLRN
mmetsp:Transcript_3488/g.10782  ORF Transcript_3488/g.10782 Transcript_3488/m.10782 type:complete len:249 (+) Transcript_3488:2533-3279(+)